MRTAIFAAVIILTALTKNNFTLRDVMALKKQLGLNNKLAKALGVKKLSLAQRTKSKTLGGLAKAGIIKKLSKKIYTLSEKSKKIIKKNIKNIKNKDFSNILE